MRTRVHCSIQGMVCVGVWRLSVATCNAHPSFFLTWIGRHQQGWRPHKQGRPQQQWPQPAVGPTLSHVAGSAAPGVGPWHHYHSGPVGVVAAPCARRQHKTLSDGMAGHEVQVKMHALPKNKKKSKSTTAANSNSKS